MDSVQTVSHAEKTCDPCGAKFTPGAYLTPDQAAAVVSCSHLCSSARARGHSAGPGKRNNEGGSDSIGTLDASGRCVCSDCDALRTADRSALIARVAAERGVSVSTGPRRQLGPGDLARIAAVNRKRRLELYEPVSSDWLGENAEVL